MSLRSNSVEGRPDLPVAAATTFTAVDVQLFGDIAVCRGDASWNSVGGPRPRLILAMLAARVGRPVAEASLIDAIWGNRPPASARTALQTYLSALRDELEPDRPRRLPGAYIATEARGYRLRAEVCSTDLAEFERCVLAGINATDPETSRRELEAALGMWAPPLAEFADAPWALGIVARLHERHAVALESLFSLVLESGDAASIADRLRAAVDQYPFRERLAQQLMVAMYRLGDQPAALAVAKGTRSRLRDALGLDVGHELRDLEGRILRHETPLLAPPPDAPVDLSSAADATIASLSPIVGRQSEIEVVAAELETHRLVTIVGTSGIGKTLLAQHVERTVASAFDRVIAVDLDDLASVDADSILRALAVALDVNEQSLGSLDDTLVDSIGARTVLVRLDTAELATDGVLQVVRRLRQVPGLRLLVTSQVPLRAAGERLVRLYGLSADHAVALLAETAPACERDATLLKELAVRLDGVPLALELAAARLDALGAAETLRQLDRGVALAGGDDRPERHRSTLAAALWSIGLLDHDERMLLARLATHTAPFTLAAAGHTWGISPLTADRVEQLVAQLIDRSLVQRVDGSSEYRLLDTIRVAVLDADTDADDAEVDDAAASNEGRLNDVVFETAVAALVGAPTAVQLDDLADELVATLDRLHGAEDERELLLAGSLALYWIARSGAAKGGELLDRALATHRAAPDEIYGPVAGIASMVAYVRGDMHRTRDLLSVMGERGGGFVSPNVQYSIDASLAFLERRYGDAAELYGQALQDFSEPSSTRLLYLWLGANTLWYDGRPDAARMQYQRLRREADEMNDRYNAALGLRFEAMVTAELGEVERAWRLAERALASAVDLGDAGGRSQAEVAVAIVAAASEAMTTARHHALNAIEATLGPYDLFTQRAAPVLAAASFLEAGDAATSATAIGWYLDYLDRTGQPPAVGVAALARRTEDGARAALGGAEFARVAAGGARLRLRGLHDLLLARDRLEQSSGADGLATT